MVRSCAIYEGVATGNSFGDYEVIFGKPMQCTVVATIPSELLAVSKFEIMQLDEVTAGART